jgi:hypothetical protein
MEIEESLSDLNSKRTGLGQEEATRRLVEFGPYELKKGEREIPGSIDRLRQDDQLTIK